MADHRLDHVLHYLQTGPADAMSLDSVSAVARLSRRHFHRRFQETVGLAPGAYAAEIRLKRAAHALAYRQAPITEIAFDSGYGSLEAFSRAFRRRFGKPPSAWRAAPELETWTSDVAEEARLRWSGSPNAADLEVVDLVQATAGVLRHAGDPAALPGALRAFIAWRRAARCGPTRSATYNIFHADGSLELCAATSRPVAANAHGVVRGLIPGGRFAALRHVGSDLSLRAHAEWLMTEGLKQAGHGLRRPFVMVQRLSLYPDVAERDSVSRILAPIA